VRSSLTPCLAYLALAFAGVVCAEELDGPITGGKAKQLVDEGAKLLAEADALYKPWALETTPAEERHGVAKRMAELYARGCDALAEALVIRYDPSVNAALTAATKRLARIQFWLMAEDAKRRPRPAPSAPEPVEPTPTQEPEPAPPPAPAPEPPSPVSTEGPPAEPADVLLLKPALSPGDRDYAARRRRDEAAIREFLRDYLDARRADKLLFKHVPCGGTGRLGGATCAECAGAGRVVNLFHFRRAFWNCFTPLLRESPGALDALRAFRVRAQADPSALGPLVKGFEVGAIEHFDFWARAQVKESTTAGRSERWVTLVRVGSQWYFYSTRTDTELLPE